MGLVALDGRLTTANAALCALTGRSAADLVGRSLSELLDPAGHDADHDPDGDLAVLRPLLAGELDACTRELRCVRPDGQPRWALVAASAVRDAAGEAAYFVVQLQDITETRAAREATAEHERRLRALAEGAPDVVMFRYRFVPELVCEYVSAGAQALLGHPPEDHYADPTLIFRLVHPDDAHVLSERRSSSGVGPRTVRFVRPDHTMVWTRSYLEPIVADDEMVGLEGVVHDATAEEELRAADRCLRSLVEHTDELMLVLDPDGVITFATPSAKPLLGYAPDELVGAHIRDVVGDPDVASARQAVGIDAGSDGGGQTTFEMGVTTRDGQCRWMEVTTTDLRHDPDVAGFVINAHDVTERRELAEQLERRANYDELTGVANARKLRDELAATLEVAAADVVPFAVVMLGLDHFETIVETFGYDFGDRVLQQAVARLSHHVDDVGFLARYESDQLAVLVLRLDQGLTVALQRLTAAFHEPLDVDGQPVHLDATFGVSTFPGHGDDAETLLQRADMARRRAAERGRGHLVYSQTMERTAPEHITLLGELRRAIDNGELELVYQPKADLASGVVVGVEALMRWHHPARGMIAPATFIPLAERSGLIRPLTLWAIDRAARQGYTWSRAGIHMPVAVNITARNLQDASFVDDVAALLQIWGRQPADLLFELTERTLVTDAATAAQACRRLHELGVGLSVDDFGTGQSALAQLMTLPFTEIKIDKAFVDALDGDPSSRGVIRAMATLGRELGQTVVAEGVEDAATAEEMARLGCHVVQGFHLAAPMDADVLSQWLGLVRA